MMVRGRMKMGEGHHYYTDAKSTVPFFIWLSHAISQLFQKPRAKPLVKSLRVLNPQSVHTLSDFLSLRFIAYPERFHSFSSISLAVTI